MKYFLKYSFVSAIILLGLYPTLHEVGHALGVVFTGGKVVLVTYIPIPHIAAQYSSYNESNVFIAGCLGLLFPIITFALIPVNKSSRTIIKYAMMIFEGIILYSLVISFVYSVLCINGKGVVGDDITIIMNMTGNSLFIPLILITLIALIVFTGIFKKTHSSLKEMREK